MVSHGTKSGRSKQYPTETMTDAIWADDLALLVNIITQAEPNSIAWSKQQEALVSP